MDRPALLVANDHSRRGAEVGPFIEALQRGVTILMNDIDGRAISELGRR